jgi:hypothetical protein
MQSGQQVLHSDQKKMEEVHRIREATAREESVLTDCQVNFIRRHAAVLGEEGETALGKIQQKARGPGCQPADVVRMVEDHCKDLSNRATLRNLSSTWKKRGRWRGWPNWGPWRLR